MVNAQGALNGGNLDEALSLATDAVDLAGSLQSDRYFKYLSDFYRTANLKHSGNQSVREFGEFARVSHPTLILPGAA